MAKPPARPANGFAVPPFRAPKQPPELPCFPAHPGASEPLPACRATFGRSSPSSPQARSLCRTLSGTLRARPSCPSHAAVHGTGGRSRGAVSRAQVSISGAARASGRGCDRGKHQGHQHPPHRRSRRCAPRTPRPAHRPSQASDPPTPHRGGEPAHAHLTAAHALADVGECAAAVSGIARRRCRVSSPPTRRPSARCCCALKAPRHGLGAARLP